MKAKLLFFLFFVMLLHVSTSTFSMELKIKQRVILKNRASQNSSRSIPIPPIAFIDGSLLSIDFPSVVNPITIIVRNEETGEIAYSSAGWGVNKIDLTGENPGKYILEIVFPTTTFTGDFEL